MPLKMPSATLAPPLFISSFLSIWNNRGFEFGASFFLTTIYPRTLLPVSIYALIRSLAAVLTPFMGRFVDTSNPLRLIQVSILGHRLPIAVSYLFLG